MLKITMDGKEYQLATTLRVTYELRTLTSAKTIQEAMKSITKLDVDGQLDLIYASYKAADKSKIIMPKDEFVGLLLDTQGLFSIADIVNKIADGLMYSGLTPEEVESKKIVVEKEVQTMTGAASSAEATE